MSVVIKGVGHIMVHVPDFVQYGSKPFRDISQTKGLLEQIRNRLRSYEEVVRYAPHQVFIGNMDPDELHRIPRLWYDHLLPDGKRHGAFGELMPEEEFYAWMKVADDFDLFWLDSHFVQKIRDRFAAHPFMVDRYLRKLGEGKPIEKIRELLEQGTALPVYYGDQLVGSFRRDHDQDDTLKAEVLMENLVAKASGSLAMLHLLRRAGVEPTDIDLVMDCTETAVGGRYNRGGGNLSKAMAEMCGCMNATGTDIRAFCCAPVHAIVTAAGLVASGIFERVVVAGGGCLAKVGMKYASHLKHPMPVLEDVLAGIAFLVTKDDGFSPVMRLDSVGKHDVGAGSAQQAIMTSLILKPLARLGMKMTDIDKYATEMHNPEITLPAGSGDTPGTNYRIMASLAALNKQIDRTEIDKFVLERGMPGFLSHAGSCAGGGSLPGSCYRGDEKGEDEKGHVCG